MTVHRLLADIMEGLKVNHVEHEAMRREMAGLATKKDLDALRGDFAGLKTNVVGIETKVVGIETDLAGIETNVVGIETKVAGIETKVAGIETKVAGIETKVTGIETKVTGIETDLAGLGQTVRKLGLDFEVFRQDSKIALDALSELMSRTSRHGRTLESHDLMLRVVENRLDIRLLAEIPGDR